MVALDVGLLDAVGRGPADENGLVELPLERELARRRH